MQSKEAGGHEKRLKCVSCGWKGLTVSVREKENVWIDRENQARHQGSLILPSVQNAIEMGKPLIAGYTERYETTPIGGYGLDP